MSAVFLLCSFQAEAKPLPDNFKVERAEHFLIYYDSGVSASKASSVKNLAEKYYRLITQEFHLIRDELWVWDKRAKIYIAEDKEQYHKLFDCQSWSEACVEYRNKTIYTYVGQDSFSKILVHELTHIIFREYVGQNTLPLWLDEGVATYMEDKYAGGHYKRYLKNIKKKISDNTFIPIDELTQLNGLALGAKPKDYVTLFYAQSYSVVNFIITKYGRHNFSRFFSYVREGMPLKKALARVYFDFREFEKLERLWKKYY
jgi:Peptidase MA superfamily